MKPLRIIPCLFSLIVVMTFIAVYTKNASAEEADRALRVMSFNIRYGSARDGENDWGHRKELLVKTIKSFNPDLLGTQETLGFQRDYISTALPEYSVLSAGRDDGKEKGEMMAIFYRKDRFKKLDGGHFWYSETPNVAGSKAWDSSLPRMASWLKLEDLKNNRTLYYFNTHFDHRGNVARIESAKLLRSKMRELAGDQPVIFNGDFNAAETSEVYRNLFDVDQAESPLIDTYKVIQPDPAKRLGTYGGFRIEERKANRIDWLGVSQHFEVLSAQVDRTNDNGRTPSDHDPINAVLRFRSTEN